MLENLFFFVLFRIFGNFRNPTENTPNCIPSVGLVNGGATLPDVVVGHH